MIRRYSNSTSNIITAKVSSEQVGSKLSYLMKYYEYVIGLTEVKAAQNKVLQAEQVFIDAQELRRNCQQKIQQMTASLKDIHRELDKTSRGEDHYLTLISQEHSIIKEEENLIEEFKQLDNNERDYFSVLSLAVQESHSKEQAQAEKMKYWSFISLVCGAVIGVLGTSFNKWMKEFAQETPGQGDLQNLVFFLNNAVKKQYIQVTEFIEDIKKMLGYTGSSKIIPGEGTGSSDKINIHNDRLEATSCQIVSVLENQEKVLSRGMKEVKTLLETQIKLIHLGEDKLPVYVREEVGRGRQVKDTEKI
ncbi:coiled-coil domain-containing protein 51-like [Limulus polyphemus]|uniref:Coiled-coil domain-containing protein 51-like n=1 Tax=Limulus polyphemus TaxID=6850 RepID=A0ABM1BFT0_LIMPO|nr:coiled-coil domain-containing protein 51-like [Limulus polyphemus]